MVETRPLLEVCVESVQGVLAAEAGGADRAELCTGLAVGGLTPSSAAMRLAHERAKIPIMALIRPRAGDFCYSELELEQIRKEIRLAGECGMKGVVVGVLDTAGGVDAARMRELIALARPMQVTFHRAFDMTLDPRRSLETLIGLSVDRVLTSGQRQSVLDGLDLVRELVALAGARIVVMPGAGIGEHNARKVVEATKAREIHFTAAVTVESPMQHRNRDLTAMGPLDLPGEYELCTTDPDRVRAFVQAWA